MATDDRVRWEWIADTATERGLFSLIIGHQRHDQHATRSHK